MAKKIVWTLNALNDLEKLKEYLEENWPPQVLVSFLDQLVNKLQTIESFPEIGRLSVEFPNRRRFVITKHNLLVYSVHQDEIVIEAISIQDKMIKSLNFNLRVANAKSNYNSKEDKVITNYKTTIDL